MSAAVDKSEQICQKKVSRYRETFSLISSSPDSEIMTGEYVWFACIADDD